jgi:hypothetical protein
MNRAWHITAAWGANFGVTPKIGESLADYRHRVAWAAFDRWCAQGAALRGLAAVPGPAVVR